jgi:2-dehydropantoate 2-reductase
MKIGIIGLGSIGSVLAFYLSKNNEVFVVTRRSNTTIRLKDIRIDSSNKSERESNPIKIVDIQTLLSSVDVIIISGKINDNKSIIEKIKSTTIPIVLAQNGIYNEKKFESLNSNIYRMVVTISSFIDEFDITHFTFFAKPLRIGCVQEKRKETIVKIDLVKELNDNELTNEYVDNIQEAVWFKAIINCCLNALSALYKMPMKNLMTHEYIKYLLDNVLDECIAVSISQGFHLNTGMLKKLMINSPPNFSSMYKDIDANIQTEISNLNEIIVTLGELHHIPVKTNKMITDFIKSMYRDSFNPEQNKLLCDTEFQQVKSKFKNPLMIKYLKNYLSTILQTLYNIGFEKPMFFSDDVDEMGNIGIPENVDDAFTYLLSEECSMREKITAFMNTIFDSKQKRPKLENPSFINYIFMTNTEWNKQRIEQLKNLTLIFDKQQLYNYIIQNKKYDLWAPIIYIYPSFVFKRNLSVNIPVTDVCSFDVSQMIEPFTMNEKKFYKQVYQFKTGECYYKNILNKITLNTQKCAIAGLSGHTILALEIANILNIQWQPMLLCMIFNMVPYHHSLTEILLCVNVMNLGKSITLDELYNNLSHHWMEETKPYDPTGTLGFGGTKRKRKRKTRRVYRTQSSRIKLK